MTNYNERLDEILDRYLDSQWDGNMRQAIIDWHNKQIEAELEALREEIKHENLRTISQIITARIDKLKESK